MAKGNDIIVSSPAQGVRLEGVVSGTPSPGTIMQIAAATEPVGGKHTWEVFNQSADGVEALIAVLLPDHLQGKTATDAYVTGTRCFLYCPAMGEELNVLVAAPGTGTGNSFAIGDRLMVDDGTGLLVADSSGDSVPFVVLETVADVVAGGTLTHVMYTGH